MNIKWIHKLAFACIAAFSLVTLTHAVNVNSEDAQTISNSLNGIGLKKAEAIVIYRKEYGAFKSLEDLQMVKGIGTKTLEKNKSEIQF